MKYLLIVLFIISSASLNAEGYNINPEYGSQSTPVNYNFAELKIGQFTIDDMPAGVEDTGLYLMGGGEKLINENLIFSGFYEGALINETYYTLSSEAIVIGLLYRNPMNDKTDFVMGGHLVYGWVEIDSSNNAYDYTDSDFGFGLSAGVRHGIDDKNELNLSVFYVSLFDDSTTTVRGEYMHYTEGRFGIGAMVDMSSDASTFALSMKWKTK